MIPNLIIYCQCLLIILDDYKSIFFHSIIIFLRTIRPEEVVYLKLNVFILLRTPQKEKFISITRLCTLLKMNKSVVKKNIHYFEKNEIMSCLIDQVMHELYLGNHL